MKPLLEDLTEFFQAKIPDAYFYGGAPEAPDNIVYTMEYKGKTGDTFSAMRQLQVNVRNTSESVAHSKAWALYNLFLLDEPILHLNDGRYLVVSLHQPPFISDRDANKKVIYTFNMQVVTQNDC